MTQHFDIDISKRPASFKFDWARALGRSTVKATKKDHHAALTLQQRMSVRGFVNKTTHEAIAADSGVSLTTVNTALNSLVKRGWLLRKPGKKNKSSIYLAMIPAEAQHLVEITPKKKKQELELDPNYVLPESIDTYLLWLYEKWGFDAARLAQDDIDGATNGLRSVVKRHLEAVTDPIERSKAFSFVTSDPLPGARVPAAVFMSRFKDLYLTYPHLKPSRATPPKQKPNPEAEAFVNDTVAHVKKHLVATPDSYSSSRDNRTPRQRTPDVLDQGDDSDDEFDSD
jgi:DNA-binding MarR family transcriptional regulator